MKRLTTDNPKRNFERLMNYAYAKNNRTHLSYAGGKHDVDLCEYVSDLAKAKGYDFSPEFIMDDGLFDNYDDDFAILYYCAVQAAELRARLKMYEDKIENRTLIEPPLKVGNPVFRKWSCGKNLGITEFTIVEIFNKGFGWKIRVTSTHGNNQIFDIDDLGETVFLTKEEAEKALEGLRK